MVSHIALPGTPDAFLNPQTWIQTWQRVIILTLLPAQTNCFGTQPCPLVASGCIADTFWFLHGEIGIDVGEGKMAKAASAEKEREQRRERREPYTWVGGNRALVAVSISRLTVQREN